MLIETALGLENREDRIAHVVGAQQAASAAAALGIATPRPVIVLIGGADAVSLDDDSRIRDLLDRGIVAVAGACGALIVTGGTSSGVMKTLGELAAGRHNIDLLGVAPAALVLHQRNPGSDSGRSGESTTYPLDENHHLFVLSPGRTWGSETEVLVAVSEAVRDQRAGGVVLLANGGAIAQHEAERFMASGWPIIALRGTGRAADSLAEAVRRRRSRWAEWHEALWRKNRRASWRGISGAAVEVHDARPGRETVDLLARRVTWHISDRSVLRAAWSQYGAFEEAAVNSKRATRRFQAFLAVGALALSGLSIAYGTVAALSPVQFALIALPLVLAVASSLSDTVAPARNWLMMRQAAESVRQAIYRSQGRVTSSARDRDQALAAHLEVVTRSLVDAGTPLGLIADTEGRPDALDVASDEFAPLTLTRYMTERVEGQLRYYRRTARLMRRREHLSIAVTAILAGAATVVALQVSLAPWVPFLVLVASTLVVLRQRARWEEKVTLCSIAIAGIASARLDAMVAAGDDTDVALAGMVVSVEDVIERELAAWSQTMRRSQADVHQFRQAHIDGKV